MEPILFQIKTLTDWDVCAAQVATHLRSGTILTLSGPLGAGKTTFTQALARVLGAATEPRSPTFSLMRAYTLTGKHGLKRLIHIDAYRLESPTDVLALNLEEEQMEPDTMLVIEWPENIQEWLSRQVLHLKMSITLGRGEERLVRVEQGR